MNPRLPQDMQDAPHLLVVGAGDSVEPSPAWLKQKVATRSEIVTPTLYSITPYTTLIRSE